MPRQPPYFVSDLLRRVRAALQDEYAPHRYTDQQIVDAVNDGLDEMAHRRADLFAFSAPVRFRPNYVTSVDSVIDIPANYRPILVDLVIADMMMREDEYANDGRAQTMLSAALARLTRTVNAR